MSTNPVQNNISSLIDLSSSAIKIESNVENNEYQTNTKEELYSEYKDILDAITSTFKLKQIEDHSDEPDSDE